MYYDFSGYAANTEQHFDPKPPTDKRFCGNCGCRFTPKGEPVECPNCCDDVSSDNTEDR